MVPHQRYRALRCKTHFRGVYSYTGMKRRRAFLGPRTPASGQRGEAILSLDDDDLLMLDTSEEIIRTYSRYPRIDYLFMGVQPFGPHAKEVAKRREVAPKAVLDALDAKNAMGSISSPVVCSAHFSGSSRSISRARRLAGASGISSADSTKALSLANRVRRFGRHAVVRLHWRRRS